MPWTPTHIGWDQQIMLLWLLLPPVFLACGLLAFAAPLFFRERKVTQARPKTATAERVLANAN